MTEKLPRSSELLVKIEQHSGDTISIAEIVTIFRESGFGLLLIVFAGFPALPFPALGIATILSLPIIFLSTQLIIGRNSLWLPTWLAKKRVSTKSVNNMVEKLLPYVKKLEFFLKPRVGFLSSKAGHKLIGIVCFMCAISIALPIPLTNTIPSMGVVIMSLGLLERDGIAIIAGMIVGIAGVIIAFCAYYFGVEFLFNLSAQL